MFGFGKKKKKQEAAEIQKQEEKNKSRTDKLVMGAIVGVAVGSVVGMSMKQKHEHEHNENNEKPRLGQALKQEPREPRSRIGKLLKKIFGKKEKRGKPVSSGAGFKKIPNEFE